MAVDRAARARETVHTYGATRDEHEWCGRTSTWTTNHEAGILTEDHVLSTRKW
jgi:hypothetical protein